MTTKRSRLGKTDSIFASTLTTTPAQKAAIAALVDSYVAADNKLTVILPPDQVAFLDHLALDIRRTTKWKVRRTEIIRALVAGLMKAAPDPATCQSEAEIAALVVGKSKSGR